MSEKIALLLDSCSDAPSFLDKREYVRIIPLLIHWDGKTLRDRIDIQPKEFYKRIKKGDDLPKTSSPKSGDILEKIRDLKEAGYQKIIAITISSGLSVTFNQIKIAAEQEKSVEIAVIDSKSIGIGSGLFAAYADDLIQKGFDFDEIVKRLERSVPTSKIFFYIPTLKYLKAGGRIGRVAGIVGSALHIKPIISCDPQGIYYTAAKVRSEKKAVDKMLELVGQAAEGHQDFRFGLAQGDNPELLKYTYDKIKKLYPDKTIYQGDVSPALGVHTGPGLIGIGIHIDK